MSDAKKCDRCGNYYVEGVTYPVVSLTSGTSKQISVIGSIYYDCDLCQNCWHSFESWWKNVKGEEK